MAGFGECHGFIGEVIRGGCRKDDIRRIHSRRDLLEFMGDDSMIDKTSKRNILVVTDSFQGLDREARKLDRRIFLK
jgi:hypothetical protein